MSIKEIKDCIFEMLGNIENEGLLLKIRNKVSDLIDQNAEEDDWWDELSDEQQVRLRCAIEEAKRGENLIPHEQVMKEIRERIKNYPS